jgi:hypothetical protein
MPGAARFRLVAPAVAASNDDRGFPDDDRLTLRLEACDGYPDIADEQHLTGI